MKIPIVSKPLILVIYHSGSTGHLNMFIDKGLDRNFLSYEIVVKNDFLSATQFIRDNKKELAAVLLDGTDGKEELWRLAEAAREVRYNGMIFITATDDAIRLVPGGKEYLFIPGGVFTFKGTDDDLDIFVLDIGKKVVDLNRSIGRGPNEKKYRII